MISEFKVLCPRAHVSPNQGRINVPPSCDIMESLDAVAGPAQNTQSPYLPRGVLPF